MSNLVLVDVAVTPKDVPYDVEDNENFGIHVHEVRKHEIGTDTMFNDSPIVIVKWFETKEERDANFKIEPYV